MPILLGWTLLSSLFSTEDLSLKQEVALEFKLQ